ncbi:MAG: hypothetical protein IAE83_00255, partial [Anaerolinea sp.]|nr:hypothetical protein [Anaerolinea sp.]
MTTTNLAQAGDLLALKTICQDMEHALDFLFDEGRGDQFFRSTLIQTLFYGVFSAWSGTYPPRRAEGAQTACEVPK